jgi:hypothetical protein
VVSYKTLQRDLAMIGGGGYPRSGGSTRRSSSGCWSTAPGFPLEIGCYSAAAQDILIILGPGQQIGDRFPDRLHLGEGLTASASICLGDNRVLALVKAFFKAGILTEDAGLEGSTAGTPQGGILSPLLANVALSVLDDHIAGMPGGPATGAMSALHDFATASRTFGWSAMPTTGV